VQFRRNFLYGGYCDVVFVQLFHGTTYYDPGPPAAATATAATTTTAAATTTTTTTALRCTPLHPVSLYCNTVK
jgi:hypothetical protein